MSQPGGDGLFSNVDETVCLITEDAGIKYHFLSNNWGGGQICCFQDLGVTPIHNETPGHNNKAKKLQFRAIY